MTDSHSQIENAERHIRSTPPNPEEALKLLAPLLNATPEDPRANLYQALALSLQGKKREAMPFALRAVELSNHLREAASALMEKLK